jgi:DNA-binding NtrC family response regulator
VTGPTERRSSRAVPVRVVRARAGDATAAAERLTIGTAADCDLVVEAKTVSRYHVEVSGDPSGIRVRDLGSTNGTLAAGVRLGEAIVESGIALDVGGVEVVVESADVSREEVAAEESLRDLVTRSPPMKRLGARIALAAASDASILISGEPGTGKEIVARTVHAMSARRDQPLVIVDCGALSPTLAASELFGHERGAFTDADERYVGAFERAGGGTILFDDIASVPLELQPMLLGVLERRSFRRVGGREDVTVDVRTIASSAGDLRIDVNRGAFRLDLYYRLAVVKLEVPPLRARGDDLEALVRAHLDARGAPPTHPLRSDPTLELLAGRAFEGNVRELFNLLDAALAIDELEPEPVTAHAAPVERHETTDALIASLLDLPYKEARERFRGALESTYLEEITRRAGGNISRAARLAGIDRSQLRQLLRRAGRS